MWDSEKQIKNIFLLGPLIQTRGRENNQTSHQKAAEQNPSEVLLRIFSPGSFGDTENSQSRWANCYYSSQQGQDNASQSVAPGTFLTLSVPLGISLTGSQIA